MTETNTVYAAMRHLLVNYDGMTWADDVEDVNLSTARLWMVGRNLIEQASSKEYLSNLAETSMVSIFPTRTGKRGLKAFLEDTTSIATHDELKIKEIVSFKRTPINDVYNDIRIEYGWNPGRKKFDRAIYIANVGPGATFPSRLTSTGVDSAAIATFTGIEATAEDHKYIYGYAIFSADISSWAAVGGAMSYSSGAGKEILFAEITSIDISDPPLYAVFKAEKARVIDIAKGFTTTTGTLISSGSSIPLWTTYAGGLSDYATGKMCWEICQASFEKTGKLSALPENLSKCYWFPADYFGRDEVRSALFYFLALVPWVTRQHEVVEYSIPITADNIVLDLLNVITFKDKIYTNDISRKGYITKVKLRPDAGEMILEVLLIPTDLDGINLIIETGSQQDLILETGSRALTYTEGAQ